MSKSQQKPKSTIELYSPTYFAACTLGGIIGTSHYLTLEQNNGTVLC